MNATSPPCRNLTALGLTWEPLGLLDALALEASLLASAALLQALDDRECAAWQRRAGLQGVRGCGCVRFCEGRRGACSGAGALATLAQLSFRVV